MRVQAADSPLECRAQRDERTTLDAASPPATTTPFLARLCATSLSGAIALLLALVALPPLANATLIDAASIEEMTVRSDAVLHAIVRRVETESVDDGVQTLVELEVMSTWHGEAPTRLLLEAFGGRQGDIATIVAGADRYTIGDEVVVFAQRVPSGAWRSLALAWGAFRIEDGFATRSTTGLSAVRRQKNGSMVIEPLPPDDVAIPVDELFARVQQATEDSR